MSLGVSARGLLHAAVAARLRSGTGLAVFDAAPVRAAAVPHAVVEEPVLSDWSTKSWAGREARLVVAVHDAGERPVRLRGLLETVEAAVASLPAELGEGWRVVRVTPGRSRIARGKSDRWVGTVEFTARMWREQ